MYILQDPGFYAMCTQSRIQASMLCVHRTGSKLLCYVDTAGSRLLGYVNTVKDLGFYVMCTYNRIQASTLCVHTEQDQGF